MVNIYHLNVKPYVRSFILPYNIIHRIYNVCIPKYIPNTVVFSAFGGMRDISEIRHGVHFLGFTFSNPTLTYWEGNIAVMLVV